MYCDECGYLGEIRAEPSDSPLLAIFNLKAQIYNMSKLVKEGYEILDVDYMKIPRKAIHIFQRAYGKGIAKDRCMYQSVKPKSVQTAGLHVHFSDTQDITDNEDRHIAYVQRNQMDMPRIIRTFDEAFATEIKEAKRQKGLYELKTHGFEYRSLPASADLFKVLDVLRKLN